MEKSIDSRIKTTSIINGETVSYTLMTAVSIMLLIALKQLFKVFIGLPCGISVIIAFVIAEVISYLLEKRFVFRKKILSSGLKQVLMLLFRGGVNFGFYKLSDLMFGNILDTQSSFVWLVAISICFFFNYFFDRILLFDCAYKAVSVRGSRIYRSFYKNRFVYFSLFLTAICISVMYIIYTIFPFGDGTVMRMDLYHQYGPLFAELYDRVVNHQSFLYSWTSGGGSSFLGNYFNYLSSPLSVLIFLFDKEDISFAISFLVSVKCILSSATFTLYIRKSLNMHSYLSAIFGVFYAFSAYFLAYYWNVMWLDGMILLPIIVLGIEQIINKGNGITYVVSLVLLFFSSYYIGFMTCIFAVIYFLAYYCISSKAGEQINNEIYFEKKYSFKALSNRKFFNRGFKFAVYSVISAGLCAFTLIPVFLILRSCSATSDTFPSSFESYFNIFDFITSHLAGLETTIRSSGDDVLPNVYSGMLAVILVPLYVANRDIRFKEKISYIVLMLFLLFSFDNNCMNFIWHAFHFPNDLPFRFSFMYSFIILVVGVKAITKIKSFEVKDICFVGMAWVFFIIVAQKLSTTKMLETTIYTSIAFVILWTAYLYLVKKGTLDKAVLSAIAVVLCFSEVLIADTQGILITQKNEPYKSNYATYTEALNEIKKADDGFYREELCYLETRMDPCYYGYNGMSTFSSMAYENYSRLQYSLGMFGNRINSYTYFPQTPVYNMMFGVKYLLHTDVSLDMSSEYYDYMFTTKDGNTDVYENKYFLPIAYCSSSNLELWCTDEGNPFEVQGEYFELATGYSDVFKEVQYLNTELDCVSADDVTQNGTYWFTKENSSYGYIDITISPAKSGNVYIYVTSPEISSIEIQSDAISSHTQQIDEPYILDIGYYEEGEEIKISLDCGTSENTDSYAEIYAYTVDKDIFTRGYNKLKECSLNINEYSDTSIIGDIVAKENCYLYSSIPYDTGWSVYIDGQKAQTFELGNSMLCTTIKAGTHTVEYRYSPNGIKYGIIISSATLVITIGYAVYQSLNKKKKEEILYS